MSQGRSLSLFARIQNRIGRMFGRTFWEPISGGRITAANGLQRIGSDYGGWIIPAAVLGADSVCYCAGAGEDISFDLGLIKRFGCQVFSYDPTPRAIEHVRKTAADIPQYQFFPIGMWNKAEVLKFYAPADAQHVSHSIVNLQKTDRFFEAPCERLSVLMQQNGHHRIDLLKLDIEGAEYKVLESLIEDRLDIRIICVEFDELHHPLDQQYRDRIASAVDALLAANYLLVAVEHSNFTLLKETFQG
jgi:FkbM family methyltransferase